jgi:hypothetical protein
MTLLHFDTPLIRSPRAPSAGIPLPFSAVRSLGALLTRLAEAGRRRREQRALDAMPFDLRKDLGWPAGDIHRH